MLTRGPFTRTRVPCACRPRANRRYAVQLLTPSWVLVTTNGRDMITREDVEEIDGLFFDAKASAKMLMEKQAAYLQ